MEINIGTINHTFLTKGAAAAVALACKSTRFKWIGDKIMRGDWVANQPPKASKKPEKYTIRQVDHEGDRRLIKVTDSNGMLVNYIAFTRGESGRETSEILGAVSLDTARQKIGKAIQPPVCAKYGVKTNNPANMCPQGPSGGGGNNHHSKKGKNEKKKGGKKK